MNIQYAKQLAFPTLRSFDDLFVRATNHVRTSEVRKDTDIQPVLLDSSPGDPRKFKVKLGPYCKLSNGQGVGAIDVEPKPEVIKFIQENMLMMEHDSIFYDIIIWDNNNALVYAQYNSIIGDRWLSIIDPKTIWQPAE